MGSNNFVSDHIVRILYGFSCRDDMFISCGVSRILLADALVAAVIAGIGGINNHIFSVFGRDGLLRSSGQAGAEYESGSGRRTGAVSGYHLETTTGGSLRLRLGQDGRVGSYRFELDLYVDSGGSYLDGFQFFLA